jgi:hypothetical protein
MHVTLRLLGPEMDLHQTQASDPIQGVSWILSSGRVSESK